MSKQKQPEKQVIITQEEKHNDVVIRSICKKIRNLNKKITDIEALEKRQDLKPEQVAKIKNKNNIIDEKEKNEEFLKYYKTIVAENTSDQSHLARGLLLSQIANNDTYTSFLSSLSENDHTAIRTLTAPAEGKITIAERSKQLVIGIQNYLNNRELLDRVEVIFNDKKFQKAEFIVHIPVVTEKQPQKIVVPDVQTVVEVPIVVEPAVEVPPVVEIPVVAQVVHVEPIVQTTQEPVVTVVSETPTLTIPSTTVEPVPAVAQTVEVIEEKKPYKKYYNRPYRPKNQGEYVKKQEDRKEGDKPRRYNNKPKYHQKKEEKKEENDTSLSSSEEREYQRRQFNKNQIRQLENDGFIVIDHRPKAKDPKDREEHYRRQHGYKDKFKKPTAE